MAKSQQDSRKCDGCGADLGQSQPHSDGCPNHHAARPQWLANPSSIDGEHQEMERIAVFTALKSFTHFGVKGNTIILRTPKGRCLVETSQDKKIVRFTWAENGVEAPVAFMMNAESVKDVGDMLRNNAGKRADFDALLIRE